MKIVIRLDDITPDMDWAKFLRFKELMDAHYVKPLIGVVPRSLDPKLAIDPAREDFWTYVEQLRQNGWTLAMHGVHHVYTTKEGGLFPLNRQSEFAGLSLEEQTKLLAEGKQILENHGIVTDLFMAPAHSYDKNTLKALKSLGFTKITDGFGNGPYLDWGMTFYPISFSKARSLGKEKGVTTFVVHCNTMTEKEFAFYEDLFEHADLLPYREYLYYEAKKRSIFSRHMEGAMAAGKRFLVSRRKK